MSVLASTVKTRNMLLFGHTVYNFSGCVGEVVLWSDGVRSALA